MKTFKLLLSIFSLMLFCVTLFSCSKQDEVLNDEHSSPQTRSIKPQGPSEYETSYQSYPRYSSIPATPGYYFSFNFSFDAYLQSTEYHRLELQYRFANLEYAECREELELTPDSEWHYMRAGRSPERYSIGTIYLGSRCTFDIDADQLPKGQLNLRYRLIADSDYYESDPYYLPSEWTIISRFGVKYDNPTGFTSTSPLRIYVNVPTDNSYSISVYVDNQQAIQEVGNSYFSCKKSKPQGKYEVTAIRHSFSYPHGGGEYRTSTKEGTYNEKTNDIYVSFYSQDFNY